MPLCPHFIWLFFRTSFKVLAMNITSKTHDYVKKSKPWPPHTWNIEFSFLLSLFESSKTLYLLSLSGTKLGPFRPNIYYSRTSKPPSVQKNHFMSVSQPSVLIWGYLDLLKSYTTDNGFTIKLSNYQAEINIETNRIGKIKSILIAKMRLTVIVFSPPSCRYVLDWLV